VTRRSLLAISLALVLAAAAACGCRDRASVPTGASGASTGAAGRSNEELLNYALDIWMRHERFDSQQALDQMLDRFNQWIGTQKADPAWKPDPLLATLPKELQELPVVGTLGEMRFPASDGRFLREALWLRDISNRARGDAPDDLSRAKGLFDWVVRNIQLESSEPVEKDKGRPVLMHQPAETLLLGRGKAVDRAWVFILLARQQGLDAVMLALGKPDKPDELRPWLPAVLSEGQLYLFEPELGLPIPGPNGKGIATLAQAVAADAIWRHLDLDADRPYPLKSADLVHVAALVEASPPYLAQRMQLLGTRLTGKNRVVVSASPSALAARLKACPNVKEVRLWTLPFETILHQATRDDAAKKAAAQEFVVFRISASLWKARVLDLRGMYTGEDGATGLYLLARPSDAEIRSARIEPQYKAVIQLAKQDATYWLGLIAYHRGNYKTAVDYFSKRILDVAPDGPWASGARYNLARSYEALGNFDAAKTEYEDDISPQRHGNLLRARWEAGKSKE
jgi:tetratricopeptide (TPR) repeat protein